MCLGIKCLLAILKKIILVIPDKNVEQITADSSMDSMISFISSMCLHFSVSHLSSVGEVRLRSVGTASNWILFPPQQDGSVYIYIYIYIYI